MSTIATSDSSEVFIVQKLSEKWEELLARVKSHFCRPETRQSVGAFLRAGARSS